jgi:hypothetical protein
MSLGPSPGAAQPNQECERLWTLPLEHDGRPDLVTQNPVENGMIGPTVPIGSIDRVAGNEVWFVKAQNIDLAPRAFA